MEIIELIDIISDSLGRYSELAEKTNSAEDPDKRISAMHDQSVMGREIFLSAADALKALTAALEGEFDEETANAVFEKTLESYKDDSLDCIILEMISKKLLDYYENTDDHEKIITILSILGYSYMELSYLNPEKYIRPSYEVYCREIEYRFDPCLIENEDCVMRILIAIYNICNVFSIRDASLVPAGWDAYELLVDWTRSDFGKKIIEKYPDTEDLIEETKEFFIGGIYSVDPSYRSKEAEDAIEERLKKGLSEDGKLSADNCFDYISHVRIKARHQPEKSRDYYNELTRYYEETMNTITDPDLISSYHTNCLGMIRELYDVSGFSPEELKKEAEYIKNHMLSYFRLELKQDEKSAVLTEAMPSLLFQQKFIELFASSQEKTDVIFKMFISRHISTYMHCNMVAVFSECIAKWALIKKPELFIGLPGVKTVDEAISSRDKLINTVRRHAMLHDVGKIGIQEIISRQYRPITDEEFLLIKLHPDIGADYLEGVSGLEECADTARGHHKFYNGQGGYPQNFDNTKSPVRLIIDMVTLSDCLDAATDYMGRNYRNVKTAAQVVEEFRAGAGVRYNPDLVELMSDTDMVAELDSIASAKRRQIFIESCNTSAMALK